MKKGIVITVLLLVFVLSFTYAQKADSQKLICQKNGSQKASVKKTTTKKKVSKLDSLLIEREFRLGEEEATKDVDLELSKMAYAPKVVLQESKGGFVFNYFQFINDIELNDFKQKLLNSFKINNLTINSSQMSCMVSFKLEASEQDKNEFFKAFGYDGIIYRD